MKSLKERIFLPLKENKALKKKRIDELPDIINLTNMLYEFGIFNKNDIENLKSSYGEWEIAANTDQHDVANVFDKKTQKLIFEEIPNHKFENENLQILIRNALESTKTLGNLNELKKIIEKTLLEIPLVPVNVKNDLELCNSVMNELYPDSDNQKSKKA